MTPAILDWQDPVPEELQSAVVTLGNFDGLHCGHHRLLAALRQTAFRIRSPTVGLCLDPHPKTVLRPDLGVPRLMRVERRTDLLLQAGVGAACVLKTTTSLLALSAEEFFERVLLKGFRIRGLVEGADFRFGRNRLGDSTLLASLCRKAGIEFESVPLLGEAGDARVSSTRIRESILAGDVTAAALLSGRLHQIVGVVDRGQGRGRTIGLPTANLTEIIELLPADGVYSVRCHVAGEASDRWVWGAANIGSNPTFNEGSRKVEIHLLDWSGDCYGRELTVDFHARIRAVQKFAGVGDLVAQIHRDIEEVRKSAAEFVETPVSAELLRTVEEWARLYVEPSLLPLGGRLKSVHSPVPGELEFRWELPKLLPPPQSFDLLFGVEARLRSVFPEFRTVANLT